MLVSTSPTFDKIKSEIVKATTLMCFDENQPVQIQTDASRSGLACCLMQARKPIAHASRALSDTEKGNYIVSAPLTKSSPHLLKKCFEVFYGLYYKMIVKNS